MNYQKKKTAQLINLIKSLPKNKDGIPLKSSFNPLSLPSLTSSYLLGKMTAPGKVIVKLAGEDLNKVFDVPLKGVDIFDILSSEEKNNVIKVQQMMFGHPCGVYTHRKLEKTSGMVIPLSTHSFPMITDNGKDKYFLMYYEAYGPVLEDTSSDDKMSSLSNYSSVQFIDIGNGIPIADEALDEIVS